MIDDGEKIDLSRFKRHERKFPWALIRKIIIAAVLIGLSVYLSNTLKNTSVKSNEIELDLE